MVAVSMLTAVATPVCMVLAGSGEDHPGTPFGLAQRLAITIGWSWIAVFAIRLLNAGRKQ